MFNEEDNFSFSGEDEFYEQPSSKKRSCPHCQNPIPADNLFCLFCGEAITPLGNKRRWIFVVAVILILAFALWIIRLL